MNDKDYSKMRGVVDEPHWQEFVQTVGGELVAPLITRQGVKNADFLFRSEMVSYQRPVQLTCAQLLVVIEVTVLGSFAKKFHALQQASTISS